MTACQSILGIEDVDPQNQDAQQDARPVVDAQPMVDAQPTTCGFGPWVLIAGGTFQMGSTEGDGDEQPVHEVDVPSFQLNCTEVTVAQYRECMAAGSCTEPATWNAQCYWNNGGFDDFPVNCVSWRQASDYCAWVGGRLPSEAEWEYAARSGGQAITYPWGDEPATCNHAVMDEGGAGCGIGVPWAVCSKDEGNTAQGVCDMAGNVWEWVQDGWHGSYNGAPTDGSAWDDSGAQGFVRGGGYIGDANAMRAADRGLPFGDTEEYNNLFVGLRCARDAP